jgi:hypothetical protein
MLGWARSMQRTTKALDVIDRNIRAQAQLIEDLLDMARVIRAPCASRCCSSISPPSSRRPSTR